MKPEEVTTELIDEIYRATVKCHTAHEVAAIITAWQQNQRANDDELKAFDEYARRWKAGAILRWDGTTEFINLAIKVVAGLRDAGRGEPLEKLLNACRMMSMTARLDSSDNNRISIAGNYYAAVVSLVNLTQIDLNINADRATTAEVSKTETTQPTPAVAGTGEGWTYYKYDIDGRYRIGFGKVETYCFRRRGWFKTDVPVSEIKIKCILDPIQTESSEPDPAKADKELPVECIKCGAPGPMREVGADCLGWLCPNCYQKEHDEYTSSVDEDDPFEHLAEQFVGSIPDGYKLNRELLTRSLADFLTDAIPDRFPAPAKAETSIDPMRFKAARAEMENVRKWYATDARVTEAGLILSVMNVLDKLLYTDEEIAELRKGA